jgi:MoaA/NifB/PqqE/SkfB family radical SAM enzyme
MSGNFLNVVRNRIGFFKEVISARLTGRMRPLLVTFSMTPRCNFRCPYCYGDYEHRYQNELTLKDVLSLVNELADRGTRFLQLSGGEPLMFQGIEQVVDLANRRGICLGMSTNGSLIKRHIDIVRKVQTIAVSLDGDEASNDANRGAGTYAMIIEGIEAAQAAGVRVHTYTTVTRNNVNALGWLLEFCKQRGIYAEFGFLVNRSLKNDNNYQGIDLDIETFKKSQAQLVEYKKRGYPILFSRQVLERVQQWPDFSVKRWMNTEPTFAHIPCYQGRLMIFIDCDGKVYPCIQMIGEFEALDFRQAGFAKAYAHAGTHNCKACYLMCVNDFNLLFALNPGVIWNNAMITVREMFFKKSKRMNK